MASAFKSGGLGCGLDVLFSNNINSGVDVSRSLPVSDIEPNKNQPRKKFDTDSIASLADSISKNGLIQPVLVRPLVNGSYQIVAGERRWRAARMAGLTEIPVIVREVSDTDAVKIAIIENVQRKDLNPIEEADSYKSAMASCNMTQEEISEMTGKSRPYIANALRLLSLPDDVKNLVADLRITISQAKILLSCNDPEKASELALKACDGNMTVKAMEMYIASLKKCDNNKNYEKKDSYFKEMEISLNQRLGRKVSVNFSGKNNKGTVTLEFYDKDDLSELASKLVT